MYRSPAALALFLNLLPVCAILAAELPPHGGATPAVSEAPAPNGDAAAKHAKRTACLKDAKTKRLVGAEKTTFLKHCVDAS